jgi:hypothetical protein
MAVWPFRISRAKISNSVRVTPCVDASNSARIEEILLK